MIVVYSLLNASALGFDVVRRPAAARLSAVLVAALTAPPLLLWELAATHPAATVSRQEQRESLAAAALIRSVRATLDATPDDTDLSSPDLAGPPSRRRVDAVQDASPLGGAGELDHLIGAELLGAGSTAAAAVPQHVRLLAADTLAEAALDAWTAGPTDPPGDAHCTLKQAATAFPPSPPDLGPCTSRLIALLADLPATYQSVSCRPTPLPAFDPAEWAQAMHQATWAIHLTGRTRPAATAQLLAAASLAGAGLSAVDLAGGGVWNSVSALVAATVVGDLLPADAARTLTRLSTPFT